jgi:hypothetical protein
VGIEPTVEWLWAISLTVCVRCDKVLRTAVKGNTHPGLAPGKIGFADRRLADFAMCVNEITAVRRTQVCGTCTHPAGFTGLNAAGYIITWYCL